MDKQEKVAGSNGKVVLDLGWRGAWQKVVLHGGPFDNPGSMRMIRISVRSECMEGREADRHLPIADFSVPLPGMLEEVEDVLAYAIDAAMWDERRVYIGCMGGYGRTGLFLALAAKACGARDPVALVRKHYTPHAVETPPQQRYVDEFDVSDVRRYVLASAWRRKLQLRRPPRR